MLLEGIETLFVVQQSKTMSEAGSMLYISQSAVSKRIANLEKKLGKKLIEPDGRYVKLTQDATTLIETIAPTFNELRGQIYDQQTLTDTSLIDLDCSETLVAGYLCQAMASCLARDPFLRISTHHTPRIIENVKSGKATLGCCAGDLPANHGLVTYHLADEPFFIISPSPLSTLPSQLITNDLNNPANRDQSRALERCQIQSRMEMDSYTAAAHLALAGTTPALVPLSVVYALNIPSQYCHQFIQLSSLTRPIHLCLRKRHRDNPRIKTMIKSIDDAVAKAVSLPSAST